MEHPRMENTTENETHEEKNENFEPLGLVDIYEIYKQRKRPPLEIYDISDNDD